MAINSAPRRGFASRQSPGLYAPSIIPLLSVEYDRVASLRAHAILDSRPDPYFDDLVGTAAREFNRPMVAINFIDSDRQWTMSSYGAVTGQSIPRLQAFCSYTILDPAGLTLVSDARQDPRFLANPAVTGSPGIRFYAGAPLTDGEGRALGALAIMDTQPGELNANDTARLRYLADAAAARIKAYRPPPADCETEEHLRFAVGLNPQIPWTAHADGMIDEPSPRWLELTGMSHEEARGTGWTAAIHEDDVPGILSQWQSCLASGDALDGDFRILTRSAGHRWFRVRAMPRREAGGRIVRWYGTLDDIHEDKLSKTALLESEHRLRFALEVGRLGAWEYDVTTRSITASDLCAKALGLSSGKQLSNYDVVLQAIHPDDRELLRLERDKVLAGDYHMDFELRTVWPDGTIHWVRLTAGASLGIDGRTGKAFGLAFDVTERKAAAEERERAQQRLIHLANHDALTGLANRRLLDARIENALAATNNGAKAALLCIDLDGFKLLNDNLGHEAGDSLLRTAAGRLSEHLPQGSLLARTGGDEFAILLFPLAHELEAETLSRRLLQALSDPVELEQRTVTIGASIGIAVAADVPVTPDQLRRNAETALFRAKTRGRNTYRMFEPKMDARLQAREALKASFQDALMHDQLTMAYQPIIDLATGRSVAFEALMRWEHPARGSISPEEFIPVAEETGWITRFGRWALLHACTEAAGWPDTMRVAVNLSAVQFASGDLVHDVQAALDASGLASDRLELEVTETLLLHDSSVNLTTLDGLRRLGVRIVMDDFGTGFSSLAYLRKFRFDKIKVDKSLITGVPDSDGGDTIVEAILGLGRSLGIAVTAEGIESAAQLAFLLKNACAQGQGYLFSPPMTASQLRGNFAKNWIDRA